MRLDIRSKDKITETGRLEPIGNKVKVKVVKNKVRTADPSPSLASRLQHCRAFVYFCCNVVSVFGGSPLLARGWLACRAYMQCKVIRWSRIR
jgi:hypothetical protein